MMPRLWIIIKYSIHNIKVEHILIKFQNLKTIHKTAAEPIMPILCKLTGAELAFNPQRGRCGYWTSAWSASQGSENSQIRSIGVKDNVVDLSAPRLM